MAFDAITVRNIVNELNNTIINAKIDKIHQPERDELLISLRTRENTYKLVISASAAHPRLHFTDNVKPNPITAPMFCMLLRKHLSGGRITAVEQPEFERVVRFDIESYNELGDLTTKHLIVEIMGRHSNIILTDSQYKILDSIKHIDFSVSSVRQVLPSLQYVSPPSQNKINPLTVTKEEIISAFLKGTDGVKTDKFILSVFEGISPIVAREISFRAIGTTDAFIGELDTAAKAKLIASVADVFEDIRKNNFAPCIVTYASDNKVIDYASVNITQYGGMGNTTAFDSIHELLDAFYSKRDADERIKQRSANLVKLVTNHLERASKKLIIQQNTVKDAEKAEKFKIYGDLIIANMYRIDEHSTKIEVENYYEDGSPVICITLDPSLTPSQNAQKYYKKYNKSKTALVETAKQIESTVQDITYLESVLHNLNSASNENDLLEISAELAEQGYISSRAKSVKNNKQAKLKQSKPMHYISSDGLDIFVGKNNHQNDYLTLRYANSSDIWFHTKNIPGSHTVIKLGIDKNVPERTMMEAANLAAYYSKAKNSSQVPVDYTSIKNVKKPNGAKPGMVIYDFYNTVYVRPDEKLVESLKREE